MTLTVKGLKLLKAPKSQQQAKILDIGRIGSSKGVEEAYMRELPLEPSPITTTEGMTTEQTKGYIQGKKYGLF